MRYELRPPSELKATIDLPASKSISNRVLVMNALAANPAVLENLSDCDDTRVTVRALADRPDRVDIGAAGTAMRFLTAFFAVTPGTHVLTGTERMKKRPIGILVDALRSLGADVSYEAEPGFPPLSVRGGTYTQDEVTLSGDVSSQYISALLMTGPVAPRGLTVRLKGHVVSRPYINMTLELMRSFGASVRWEDDHSIWVEPTGYEAVPFRVENDWSAASYWYEMVALSDDEGACVTLPGLDADSYQGDARIREFFVPLGVETRFTDGGVVLRKGEAGGGTVVLDLLEQPDLAQTLVVACALLERPFHFYGLQSLKIKETDRIAALRAEMRKLGFLIQEANDAELYWNGGRCEPDVQPLIRTYEDHRMAMAFAPACFRFPGLRVDDVHVVSKSYPRYWGDLEACGFQLQTVPSL